jgi:hypothetical protein
VIGKWKFGLSQCSLFWLLLNSGWDGNNIEIVGKIGKNTFVVTEQVIYLAYVETNTPKYRVFCYLTSKIDSVKHSPLELSLSLKLNHCQFFRNPILFVICTNKFSKLCKKINTVACRRVLTSTPL